MSTLEEIKQQLDAEDAWHPSLRHLMHMFQGYRDAIQGETDPPYSPGSARDFSWQMGQKLAAKDKENASDQATASTADQ